MASLGQKLKDERIRQGKEVRTIADQLRIGSRYLEAIEAEDWKQLPGGFFNRSFIRQYAAALGFDAGEIEREFSALVKPETHVDLSAISAAHDPRAKLDQERQLISIEPLSTPSSGRFDSKTGLAVAALVLLVAGGGALSLLWDRWNTGPDARKQHTAAVPSLPAAQSTPESKAPESQTAAATATPDVAVVPATSSTADGNLTLNIQATEKTWIEVTAGGKRIFVGVLEPGESKSISTQQRARMVVGNAGGIAVRKGGQDIGLIGPRGQVRTVNITQEAVEIVAPGGS